MKSLEWVIWLITGRCNLNCKHCYASQYRREVEASTSAVIKVLCEAYSVGVEHVNFTGGEPLLRRDLFEILRECKDLGISTSVFTNSTLISEDVALKLSRLEVPVYTSLEGPNREVHESIRGLNSWSRALKGMGILRRYGIPFHINVTVTSLNWSSVGETLEKAVDLGAYSTSIIPAMPVGNSFINGISPSPLEFKRALVEAYYKAKELRVEFRVWCSPFTPIVLGLKSTRYTSCREWGVVDISPSGRVLLCDVLGLSVGNVVEEGFEKAWEKMVNSEVYRETSNPHVPLECRNCRIASNCRGGCYARSYLVKKTFEGPDPLCPMFEDTSKY